MMRKPKFKLIQTSCRRCGEKIFTANRSLHGNDALKADLGSICQNCTTAAEEEKMLNASAANILRQTRHSAP